MIKLAIIIQSGKGGASKYVRDLLENLDRRIFDISLLYTPMTADQAFTDCVEVLRNEITVVPIEEMQREINFKTDWKAFKKIDRQLKKDKPDIVLCLSSKAGVLGRIAAKKNKVSKIFYNPLAYAFMSKDEFSSKKKLIFILIEKFLSRHFTSLTIVESEGEKQAALEVRLDKENKFQVIRNAMNDQTLPVKEKVRESLGLSPKDYVIGITSRLSEQKNPKLFMEIARQLLEERPNLYFVWIGDGPLEKEIKDLTVDLGIDDRISFLGYRNDSGVLVSAFDAYLSTSLYEGLPFALMEAIRVGVPLFASDVIGNNEVVIENENGQLFKLDEANIKERFDKFLEWESRTSKEKIRQSFLDNFSMTTFVKDFTEAFLKER